MSLYPILFTQHLLIIFGNVLSLILTDSLCVLQVSNNDVRSVQTSHTVNQMSDNLIDDAQYETANDISPSSDICMEYDNIKEAQEEDENDVDNNNDDQEARDGDSLDEGVGDISSEYDLAESPQLKSNIHDNLNNNNSDDAKINATLDVSKSSDEPERRPSRISFETPL